MKNKLFLPIIASSLFLIVGCGTSKEQNEEENYVDVLPSETKDGNILHCFNWTYKQIEQNLDVIANNGFKSVQLSPVQQPKSGGAFWWSFYQPVSLSLAYNSPLGSTEDLKSLCSKAEELGVSVIADIVFNHLANIDDKILEPDGTPSVSKEVLIYEPEIYQHRNDKENPTFHHNPHAKGAGAVTQTYPYGKLPDLNTANPLVQEKCLNLLKSCIDVGIDGFRFDAAKHIETPNDKEYASDFWVNTLGEAKKYYLSKTNKELFAYGEVLNDPEGGRKISDYTSLMSVTDSGYIGNSVISFIKGDAQRLVDTTYSKNTDPANLVTWVESHDSYQGEKTHQKIKRVSKMWSVLSSRKDSRGLFFARPDKDLNVGKIADYSFENEVIASANRFHNQFVGFEEQQVAEGSFYINQRFNNEKSGAMIVSTGSDLDFNTSKLTSLKNGKYFDQITGQEVEVKNGKVNFKLDECGVAILTKTKNVPHPYIEFNEREGVFVGSKSLEVTTKNASESYYTINDGEKVPFEGKTTIQIGDVVDKNNNVTLKIVAKNGDFETSRFGYYSKTSLIAGKFNVLNINPKYFEENEIYLWEWVDNSWSKWTKDYVVQDGIMLVDTTGLDGFLLGLFPRDYVIKSETSWDSGILKQTSDIKGDTLKQGFYDASSF